jgi:hypothetical protein
VLLVLWLSQLCAPVRPEPAKPCGADATADCHR